MRLQPSLLWNWNRTLDRAPYFLTAVVLFLVKFGHLWSDYIIHRIHERVLTHIQKLAEEN